MGAALAVAGLWILFASTHMLGSSLRFRPRLVRAVGATGFLGLYSVVALAIFVPLVWIYFTHKHAGPWLWGPVGLTGVARFALYGVTGVAFVSVAAGLLAPSPASLTGKIGEPRGLLRITRHPLNMGIALFGLAHLVPNGSLADVAFFGGLVVWALLGSWHQDQRKLATVPGYREFHDATPFLPFTKPGALQGLREVPPSVLGAGVALTILLRTFHASWFGG